MIKYIYSILFIMIIYSLTNTIFANDELFIKESLEYIKTQKLKTLEIKIIQNKEHPKKTNYILGKI